MSTDTVLGITLAAVVKSTTTMAVRHKVQFASIALLYYDYLLTWTQEVEYFWRRKPNMSTLLYFCCRYALAANVIYAVAMVGKISPEDCDVAYKIGSALCLIGRFGILMVWGTRTYIIFDRSKWILALFTALGVFVLALSAAHVPYVTCDHRTTFPLGVPPQLLAITTTIFEVLAAIFAIVRIIRMGKAVDMGILGRKSLAQIILEQGAIYIGCVALLQFGAIIFVNVKTTGTVVLVGLLNSLTMPVSGMLTCRFLIHLQEWKDKSACLSFKSNAIGPIVFAQEAANNNEEVDELETVSSWSDEFRTDPLFNVAEDGTVNDITNESIGSNRV